MSKKTMTTMEIDKEISITSICNIQSYFSGNHEKIIHFMKTHSVFVLVYMRFFFFTSNAPLSFLSICFVSLSLSLFRQRFLSFIL